jgi:Ca2+-binding RTX toxin-like protein
MKKLEVICLSRTFAVLGLLLFWTGPLYAAFFYVGPTGSDSNPGTLQRPWRTITRANQTLQPGDTVFIMNGEYRGQRIAPANSGTPDNYITYSAYLNDTPVLTAPPREPAFQNDRISISLVNRDYIRIIGLTVDGLAPFRDSNIDMWVLLLGADHNIIQDSVFRRALGYHGLYLQDSRFNEILDNSMDLVGDYDANAGEIMNLNCSNSNLVQGNTMSRGGHDVLVSNGNMNVLRENILNNRWGPNQGYRAVTLTSNSRFCDRVTGYNLFERNTIMNVLVAFDLRQSVAAKAEGRGQIMRNNVFTNNLDNAISSSIRPPIIEEARLGRIYNNTLYKSGALWRIQDFGNPGPADHNEFKNNAVVVGAETDNFVFIGFNAPNRTLLEDNTFIANSFGETTGTHRFRIEGIGAVSLDFLQTNFSRFFRRNLEVLPQFVSVDPQSPNAFRLPPGSPLIDRGEVLTRTLSAGSGTSVPVGDAGYFSDGFGIVEGDRVQIDASAPVEVTNVNYETNTLTLASARSWFDGAQVNLPFQGDAPDIGAFEFTPAQSSGSLQFSAPTYQVNENGGNAVITVTRTGGSGGAVSVHFTSSNGTATEGADYLFTDGFLTWGAGDTAEKTFTVPIIDDTDVEGNETVNLTLNNPNGGATLGTPRTAVLSIIDNDMVAASCAGQTATIIGTAAGETINGTAAADVINGLGGNDIINGLGGNDRVCGGGGDDTLEGGVGSDILDGGAGSDLARFSSSTAAVTVNLGTGTATGAGTDTLTTVESVAGSDFADTLIGDARANALSGRGGNDLLDGGAGNDILDGGSGLDTAQFSSNTTGVTANLATGTATGAGTDTLSTIERVSGSNLADTLTGNNSANILSGRDGNDRLNGAGGNDTLNGDAGNDAMNGGAGTDTCNGGAGSGDTRTACENFTGVP